MFCSAALGISSTWRYALAFGCLSFTQMVLQEASQSTFLTRLRVLVFGALDSRSSRENPTWRKEDLCPIFFFFSFIVLLGDSYCVTLILPAKQLRLDKQARYIAPVFRF